MREKEGRTVTLNDKGILLVGMIILTLTFALGFMFSSKMKQENNIAIFTREELERIVKLQEMEDTDETGAEIYAYKDKDGRLMIGWNYED